MALVIIVILVLGVIFVNGWTDAPNAIATVISTGAMRARPAIIMAAICNFFGLLLMTMVSSKVATTVGKMVDFGTGSDSVVALAASLFAIVLWAVAAWYFGIPTSESHALIAGVTGAGIAISGFSAVNLAEWVKVFWGLGISSIIGFGFGYAFVKLVEFLFRHVNRQKTFEFFTGGQIISGAINAFLHGAQDGQKFMAIFMLGIFLAKGGNAGEELVFDFFSPQGLMVLVLCSLVMGIGTSIGGYKIIKAVGMDMVKLERYQGFSADMAAACCLLFASLTGIPISTTHTKTTAIMGVGASRKLSDVNWKVVLDMVLAWVLTFPGCMLISYLMAKLFLLIF